MQKNSDQLQIFNVKAYQTSTLLLSDSLAKIYQLLENEVDYKLTEAAYSLKQCVSLGLKNPNILSLKMSKGCFPAGQPGYPKPRRYLKRRTMEVVRDGASTNQAV